MKAKQIRYLGVVIALVIIFIGYRQNHFYLAWIGISVSVIFSLVADMMKSK